jgi:hypothetical protein
MTSRTVYFGANSAVVALRLRVGGSTTPLRGFDASRRAQWNATASEAFTKDQNFHGLPRHFSGNSFMTTPSQGRFPRPISHCSMRM